MVLTVLLLLVAGVGVGAYALGRGSVDAGSAATAPVTDCADVNLDPVTVGTLGLAENTLTCLLAKHVPPNIRPDCTALTAADREQLPTAELNLAQPLPIDVFLKCAVSYGNNSFDVWYLFKHDRKDVGTSYLTVLTQNGVDVDENSDSDDCAGAAIERRWYELQGQPAGETIQHTFTEQPFRRFYPAVGRFACWLDQNQSQWIAWTDANLTVLSLAKNPTGGDWRTFQEWWSTQAGLGHPPSA